MATMIWWLGIIVMWSSMMICYCLWGIKKAIEKSNGQG